MRLIVKVICKHVSIQVMIEIMGTGPRTDPWEIPNGRCCEQDNVPDMLMN